MILARWQHASLLSSFTQRSRFHPPLNNFYFLNYLRQCASTLAQNLAIIQVFGFSSEEEGLFTPSVSSDGKQKRKKFASVCRIGRNRGLG